MTINEIREISRFLKFVLLFNKVQEITGRVDTFTVLQKTAVRFWENCVWITSSGLGYCKKTNISGVILLVSTGGYVVIFQ